MEGKQGIKGQSKEERDASFNLVRQPNREIVGTTEGRKKGSNEGRT